MMKTVLCSMMMVFCSALFANATHQNVLPPVLPWSGKSESLVVPANDPWATKFEKTNFLESPSYEETVAWFEKLVSQSPMLKMISIGKSDDGRDIWMIIASSDQSFSPDQLKASAKPIFLAQAGIHSGEIDGKDAGMMLLRDIAITQKKKHLLDHVQFLFIPIFSVDAHERRSAYGRINQRGPSEMGWRTNSRNLNLNRDYAKIDSAEMRAMVSMIQTYRPSLYFDIHVTDGADYQYDITYGSNTPSGYSSQGNQWLSKRLFPFLDRGLKKEGHIPGRLVGEFVENTVSKGLIDGNSGPRYSTGYGDARHLPTVLIENHSLKTYKQRVLGTYVLLQSALECLAKHGQELQTKIKMDESSRRPLIPATWKQNPVKNKIDFLAIKSQQKDSSITQSAYTQWLGVPEKVKIPLVMHDVPDLLLARPKSYLIPPAWKFLADKLKTHGVVFETLSKSMELEVDRIRVINPSLSAKPFEGHAMVSIDGIKMERVKHFFPAGTTRVSTDQPLGDLVMLLLEPQSPDSFYRWGFMLETMQLTEYSEEYVMEPMAQKMLEENPSLSKELEVAQKKSPEQLKSKDQILHWFYAKTPFMDTEWNLYPIAREF